MSISAISSQTGPSSQNDTTALESSKQKILNQIKKLQKEDATKNSKEIQSLQQQAQQIELQIQQVQAKSQNSTASESTAPKQNAGPAYSLQLGKQDVQNSAQNLCGTKPQTVDISI